MERCRFELKLMALVFITGLCIAVLLASRENTTAGVWNQIAHGNTDTGAQLDWSAGVSQESSDTGMCRNCHAEHAHLNGTDTPNLGAGYPYMLPADNVAARYLNATCFRCHEDTLTTQVSWPGLTTFELSSHWTSANVIWPASGYQSGICRNCHEPHGTPISATSSNLISAGGPYTVNTQATPNLLRGQEEYLCYQCHDGAPAATNIQGQFTTGTLNDGTAFYQHPVNRDAANNDRTPWWHENSADTFAWGGTRHVECTDCHNPHFAKAGLHAGNADTSGGNVLLGSYGAAVTYGAPNTYTLVQATSAANNYEPHLCFRCHSGYTTGLPANTNPNTLTDVANDFRPVQRSIHPVMGRGKLTSDTVPAGVWVLGWDTTSFVTCSDCHYLHGPPPAGDYAQFQGALLRTSRNDTPAAPNENHVVCYLCHKYEVYSGNGAAAVVSLSRVDHPVSTNHDVNANNVWNIWCMSCHGGMNNGGMHGSDTGVGWGGGVTAQGDHFMNGAALTGFSYRDGGASKVACWSKNGTDGFNTGCTQNHGGTNQGTNYDY